ncbi:uncharacterized protein BDV14DRAFT_195195 [Aspergillus stella-maris]|uniref:uncharacterized protein n=1 Tax=Aspergillus stella-maris TaxID=1810926 RepID=UPI003CCDB159
MCGPSRPATGHRIAIMFPSPSTSRSASPSSVSFLSSPASSPEPEAFSPAREAYSLSFQQAEQDSAGTKAVFRAKDANETGNGLFEEWRGIEMRIERHGDLTLTNAGLQPLHQFQLRPSSSDSIKAKDELEFSLPERLDLNVSEKGIVGRQVTVVARGERGEVLQMGNGIVGFD